MAKLKKKSFILKGKMSFPPDIVITHKGEINKKPEVISIKLPNLYTKCDFMHLSEVRTTIDKIK